jgi:hypothetical protein
MLAVSLIGLDMKEITASAISEGSAGMTGKLAVAKPPIFGAITGFPRARYSPAFQTESGPM